MSVLEGRGGIPHVFRETVDHTTGRYHRFPFTSKYVQIRVLTNPCKVYFSEDDFVADVNYILIPVPATTAPYGEWQGPVEAGGIWLRGSVGSSAVELVAYQRRG
jgi:hypothetical protein